MSLSAGAGITNIDLLYQNMPKLPGKGDEVYTDAFSPQHAAEALTRYFDRVLVKLNKDGCHGDDERGSFLLPNAKQFSHVDSTGAGDAFLAGFCYGLFHDYPFRDCVAFGNLTGGKAVTKVGALTAYLTEDELLMLKQDYDRQG